MKISEVIQLLEDAKKEHGDVHMSSEYYCNDCEDYHNGNGFKVRVVGKTLAIEVKELWED